MWIYMSRESPPHSGHGLVPNVFNWTMTYRQDSDFPISYGICVGYDFPTKKLNLMKNEGKNWAKNKTKLTAWISSNCNSPSWPRTKFVKELSKKMPIDMFGKCGGRPCPGTECFERLRSYKFYLAFENSRCTDYITEKMWRNSFVFDAVPIVYGTNKQNYEKLAPPNSFIHLSDFPNMTSLANYIKLLDRNDTLYNTFLRWKDFCFIDEQREPAVITQDMLCSITKKLRSVDKMSKDGKEPVIADLKKIWFDTSHESPSLPLPV
ncbi:Alpha-(1,3)-fucosyltransferase 4 [Holothuria leucospilota]|uniref:Fucosyltransferase n=1 Tax=Holothuria leucospilota TaxID=206669 RepID=A0A9Q0YK98_HOLLE|nr:Alpha-(1,3)-fucosyltransferase 4 [Holothuria leucospilota]